MSASTPEDLDPRVEDTDAGPVVHLHGELDLASAPQLEEAIAAATTKGPLPVTLDLSQVTFIDSSALRALVRAGRELAAEGRVLQIGPRSEVVSRVLEMTQLDQQA
ncbi:MAG: STAS domain-containing protein, partial [Acidimicrobiales bacterium]